jgi:hypothetical protein
MEFRGFVTHWRKAFHWTLSRGCSVLFTFHIRLHTTSMIQGLPQAFISYSADKFPVNIILNTHLIHHITQTDTFLSQSNSVHILATYFSNIYFNVFFVNVSVSFQDFLTKMYGFLVSLLHATCSVHFTLLDLTTLDEKYTLWSYLIYHLFHSLLLHLIQYTS